jgi:hypothetical protein
MKRRQASSTEFSFFKNSHLSFHDMALTNYLMIIPVILPNFRKWYDRMHIYVTQFNSTLKNVGENNVAHVPSHKYAQMLLLRN